MVGVVTRSPQRRAGCRDGRTGFNSRPTSPRPAPEAWRSPRPPTRTPLAHEALRLGLAVVCDKPFALDRRSAREATASRGRRIAVHRLPEPTVGLRLPTARELIADGALGEVTRFESRFERSTPERGPARPAAGPCSTRHAPGRPGHPATGRSSRCTPRCASTTTWTTTSSWRCPTDRRPVAPVGSSRQGAPVPVPGHGHHRDVRRRTLWTARRQRCWRAAPRTPWVTAGEWSRSIPGPARRGATGAPVRIPTRGAVGRLLPGVRRGSPGGRTPAGRPWDAVRDIDVSTRPDQRQPPRYRVRISA